MIPIANSRPDHRRMQRNDSHPSVTSRLHVAHPQHAVEEERLRRRAMDPPGIQLSQRQLQLLAQKKQKQSTLMIQTTRSPMKEVRRTPLQPSSDIAPWDRPFASSRSMDVSDPVVAAQMSSSNNIRMNNREAEERKMQTREHERIMQIAEKSIERAKIQTLPLNVPTNLHSKQSAMRDSGVGLEISQSTVDSRHDPSRETAKSDSSSDQRAILRSLLSGRIGGRIKKVSKVTKSVVQNAGKLDIKASAKKKWGQRSKSPEDECLGESKQTDERHHGPPPPPPLIPSEASHKAAIESLVHPAARTRVKQCTELPSPSYVHFISTLTSEVAGQHSALHEAFTGHLLPDNKAALPSGLDESTIKQLGTLNHHLKEYPCECRSTSQLVNDKKYRKQQRKLTETKAAATEHVGSHMDHTEIESQPEIARIMNKQQSGDVLIPAHTPTRKSLEKNSILCSKQLTAAAVSVVKNDIPSARSGKAPVGRDQLVSNLASASTDTAGSKRPQLSISIPTDSTCDTPAKSSAASASSKKLWDVQLRPSRKSQNDDMKKTPPWADVSLRPVATNSERVKECTPVRSATERLKVSTPKKKTALGDTIATIPLKTEKEDISHRCHVVVEKKTVMLVKSQHCDVKPDVVWMLPRTDIEEDGMNLNMPTLTVTLLLKDSAAATKILPFPNPEDCLRFATAFYDMTATPVLEDSAPGPVLDECERSVSDTVNSSVRGLESLNDEEQNVLERYRELRQTKPPNQAMEESMSCKDTNMQPAEALATMIAKNVSQDSPPSVVGELPSSPVSTFTTTTVGEKTTGCSIQGKLNTEEEGVVLKYRLMLKRGVPADAVRHKLTRDNASGKIVSAVFSNDTEADKPEKSCAVASEIMQQNSGSLSREDQAIADKYCLMLKRGIPADAVRHKLTRDNASTLIVSAVFANDRELHNPEKSCTVASEIIQQNSGSLSREDQAIADKYRKMFKFGIPAEAVKHKMLKEDVDPKIMTVVLGTTATVLDTNSELTSEVKKESLSEEDQSTIAQYKKLLKVNIPRDAVLARMQSEGVSEKIVEAVLGVGAVIRTKQSSSDESKCSGGASTGSNLINLHWNAMEDVPVGSVWETSNTTNVPERGDISKLVELFQKKKPSTLRKEKKAESVSATGKAKLLDLTRANNIAISLKAFKQFSNQELADIISFLDPTRKIRGEKTQFIRDLLPTTAEMKTIDDYVGSDDKLVPAEIWFRHLRGIKRLDTKVQVLRTIEMFTSEVDGIRESFRILSEVCRQIVGSAKLKEVLGMVLRIGNVMNEGTRTGGAAGFRFDSLLRLTQTKTSDGKITVLDYLITVFVAKGQRETLSLLSDFPDCHTASRLLLSDLTNETKGLRQAMKQCQIELDDMERDISGPRTRSVTAISASCSDPRAQLFASIQNGARESKSTVRDNFLAAISNSNRADPTSRENDEIGRKKQGSSMSPRHENSVCGGVLRLKQFLENVEDEYEGLESQRGEALEACKDLSRYCGEGSGTGSAISLLGILSQFAKNVEDALVKFDERERHEARTKRVESTAVPIHSTTEKETGTSLILLVNDVLKNANPRFKEDFKKGRIVHNPSNPLKVIYDRELSNVGVLHSDNGLTQTKKTVSVDTVKPISGQPQLASSLRCDKSSPHGAILPCHSPTEEKRLPFTPVRTSLQNSPGESGAKPLPHGSGSLKEVLKARDKINHSGAEPKFAAAATPPRVPGAVNQMAPPANEYLIDQACNRRNSPSSQKGTMQDNSSLFKTTQLVQNSTNERRKTLGSEASPNESSTARLARKKRLSKRMSAK